MRLFSCFVFLSLQIIVGSAAVQQASPPKPATNAGLTPTADPTAKSGVYIPKDLDDALKEMQRMLPASVVAEMKQGSEQNMGRYHFGLGTWMRNNWGLWGGSQLAQWFKPRGVWHPDDMSGILLKSFWRVLHDKPILLEEQVKYYQAYWKQEKKSQQQEKLRVSKAKAQIQQRMLGFRNDAVAKNTVPVVPFPPHPQFGVRIRYAAPFFGGGLITAKQITGIKNEAFTFPAYVVDIAKEQLRPVQIPEMARVENAVVVDNGATAYFHGPSAEGGVKKEILLEVRADGSRHLLPTPPGTGFIRLGLGVNNELLVVRPEVVYRWRAGKPSAQQWERLYTGSPNKPLPFSGIPPQLLGNRLYFRDEGYGEDDKRLSWLPLNVPAPPNAPPGIAYFDEDTGMVGSDGPRWENVWSVAYTAGTSPTGTLWIASGHIYGQPSLLCWTPGGGYRIALFNGRTHFGGDFFENGDLEQDYDPATVTVTGIETPKTDGSFRVIGPHGIYEIKAGTIRPLLRFTGTGDWIPTHLLALKPGVTLLGGHFGGVYLLKTKAISKQAFRVIRLDERIGPPIRL